MMSLPTSSQNLMRLRAHAELERRRRAASISPTVSPPSWRDWLAMRMPSYVAAPCAQRHVDLWDWVWAITPGVRPRPFVAVWPRGGGKSTTAELACVAIGMVRQSRRYAWYVCETQDQADNHVSTIAGMLEAIGVDRAVNKYGASKGWRRNRLRTDSGFTVDALGLDVAARGGKLDDQRPDLMIFDDLDGEHDTPETTEKKIMTMTRKLLPAGGSDTAILAIQNIVHEHSIFARLVDGRADFLGDRIVSGPHVAVAGLVTDGDGSEARIVGGAATWEGQSLADCQHYITTWGLDTFRSECQHTIQGGKLRFLSSMLLWDACEESLPTLSLHEPAVIGLDAGIKSDAFALVLVTRHPRDHERVAVRHVRVWYPPAGGMVEVAGEDGPEQEVRRLCRQYAVQQVAYDPAHIYDLAQRLTYGGVVYCEEFPQGERRLIADKQLLDLILQRRISHTGDQELRQHLDNANRKLDGGEGKLRIIKRSATQKVDAAVALSMAAHTILELNV